jgi:histidyl-tRNA synthetase
MKFAPPRGTRDFLPEDNIAREYVINTIKKVFVSYGFDELQTPAFEEWNLLAAKCGENVKQQIFKFRDKAGRELGLRFDLTIGMARVIANNPQIPKPFKRYCIAPVWRYEDVTKGRKREFWQADIDIVGSSSMEAEAECLACAVDCFKSLGFENFQIFLNNRKILDGLLALANISLEKNLEIFRAIDKLEKIGKENVKKELERIGLEENQIKKLFKLIAIKGEAEEVLDRAKKILRGIKIAEEGLEELNKIFELSRIYDFSKYLIIDFSLARGLDYYTGPIFEIRIQGEKIGSIAGGGRYDKLIEILGGKAVPATGISLGIERIVQIMEEKNFFEPKKTKVKVFVANVNEKVKEETIKISQKLREKGISCQTDLMNRSLTKQLEYCDALGIPFVLIVGEREIKEKKFKLRDMQKKTEKKLSLEKIIKFLGRKA